jgi:DNA-binding MarR family transcriptional regulator
MEAIMKPKKLGRVVLKEEFFAITECLEEAIVLNQMCYWSERMKEMDEFLEEEYTMLVDHIAVLSHGWIYKSAAGLAKEMFGAVSEKTMNRILDRLVNKNFLRRRRNPNPKYKFDKTYHYRVNFVEIILKLQLKKMPLSGYQVIEECADRINKGVAPKRHFDGSNDHVDGAIPETITETTNKENLLTSLKEELESSAVASHSSVDLNQTNLFPTKPNEGHISGSANAKLKSADGKEKAPHCAAPPRNKKSSATQIEKPAGVSEQVWDDFIFLRKAKRAPLSATALASISKEAEKAAMHIEEALTECVTRGWQSFKADWMKPKTTTKSERFSNF